jgi:hypothetical protein
MTSLPFTATAATFTGIPLSLTTFIEMKIASVDPLELAALADLAVLVPGQRLDDEMARIARQGGPALGVVVPDGHGAHVAMTSVP